MSLFVDLEVDSLRQKKLDRMRITQVEGGHTALDFGPVAGSDDIELARKAGGDALHGIGRKGACEAMERCIFVAVALNFEVAIVLLDVNPLRHGHRQFPLWPLHLKLRSDVDLHTGGQRNWFFPYS